MALERPHLLIRSQEPQLRYQSRSRGGGGGGFPAEVLDRPDAARRLIGSLRDVVGGIPVQDSEVIDEERLPVSFRATTDWGLPNKLPGRGNEVLSVTGFGHEQTLNVALDPGTLVEFEERAEAYVDWDGGRRPNYFYFFEAQPVPRATSPKDLWTSREPLPRGRDATLWELWISTAHEVRFREVLEILGMRAPRSIRLGSMHVVPVEATPQQMRELSLSATIAQLRPASSLSVEAYSLPSPVQVEAVAAARRRIREADGDAPAVCLLDTGVRRTHPLLEDSLDLAVSVARGSSGEDWEGHGTKMAGLALFEDLPGLVMDRGRVDLETRLESVQVVTPPELSAPSLAADRLKRAVRAVEEAHPDRARTFCLAWNTPLDGDDGAISSLSCEVDRLAAQDGEQRLFCVAGGNVTDAVAHTDYQSLNDLSGMLSPAPAWNALVVGACTSLVSVPASHQAMAPDGDLSPWSRTSISWESGNLPPAKPDLVCEGGNRQSDLADDSVGNSAELCLLTTSRRRRTPLAMTGQTSAATATVAGMCARLQANYPDFWPESIRGLAVHSADYTDAMMDRARSVCHTRTALSKALRSRFGAGRIDYAKAIENAESSLTLVAQGILRPLRLDREGKVVAGFMRAHELPWPTDALRDLGDERVELRVTLSYFVEPDPSAAVQGQFHEYASHGFGFDIKRADETLDEAIAALNALEDRRARARPASSADWLFGPKLRARGSLKYDRAMIAAEDLAEMDGLLVYPTKGWWAHDDSRVERDARYSLIVSIHTRATEIYTEVATEISVG